MSRLRYVTTVAVLFSFLGSLLMFYIGAVKTIQAVRTYFLEEPLGPNVPAHLDYSEQATIAVVESIDAFLIALVLMIFSAGVYTLFIGEIKMRGSDSPLKWLHIHSIEDLKRVLAEVVLVILAVLFLRLVLYEAEDLQWEVLVLPAGMALLAVALKLVGWQAANRKDQGNP